MRRAGIASLCLALAASGCDLGFSCKTDGVVGLRLFVRHALTQENEAPGATGIAIATEGGYSDSLRVLVLNSEGVPLIIGGVVDRPGSYQVTISKPGFLDLNLSGVVIGESACGIAPTEFTVALEPDPAPAVRP